MHGSKLFIHGIVAIISTAIAIPVAHMDSALYKRQLTLPDITPVTTDATALATDATSLATDTASLATGLGGAGGLLADLPIGSLTGAPAGKM